MTRKIQCWKLNFTGGIEIVDCPMLVRTRFKISYWLDALRATNGVHALKCFKHCAKKKKYIISFVKSINFFLWKSFLLTHNRTFKNCLKEKGGETNGCEGSISFQWWHSFKTIILHNERFLKKKKLNFSFRCKENLENLTLFSRSEQAVLNLRTSALSSSNEYIVALSKLSFA